MHQFAFVVLLVVFMSTVVRICHVGGGLRDRFCRQDLTWRWTILAVL